jgi:hypothetical protein
MNNLTIMDMLKTQKKFSNIFFKNEELSTQQKTELTKTFCLSLHSEVSQLINAVDYKQHMTTNAKPDIERVLFESVDCVRYVLALLNLWGLTAEDFIEAFEKKDRFLHERNILASRLRAPNQKVIICDIDDVLSQFRIPYAEFVKKEFGVVIDSFSEEYYNIEPITAAGIDPDEVFSKFVSSGMFSKVPPCSEMIDFMHEVRAQGYWIQLLTARPGHDARCKYDTYDWLSKNKIPFDGIDFTPEKYMWLSDKEFYSDGSLVCAIDDSLKHAAEYARHGVHVIVPAASYNASVPPELLKKIQRVEHTNVNLINAIDNIKQEQKGKKE